jgi:uncharacterized membrane protein YesL
MRLWIISLKFFRVRNQYQQAFLVPFLGRKTSAELTLNSYFTLYLYFYLFLFIPYLILFYLTFFISLWIT